MLSPLLCLAWRCDSDSRLREGLFSTDGRQVVAVSDAGVEVAALRSEHDSAERLPPLPARAVRHGSLCSGERVAIRSDSGQLSVYSKATWKLCQTYTPAERGGVCIAGGDRVVELDRHYARLSDLQTSAPLGGWVPPAGVEPESLAVSPDGQRAVVCARRPDSRWRHGAVVLAVATGRTLSESEPGPAPSHRFTFTQRGTYLTANGSSSVWRVSDGRLVAPAALPRAKWCTVSPDEQFWCAPAALADGRSELQCRGLPSGRLRWRLRGVDGQAPVAVSDDGQLYAAFQQRDVMVGRMLDGALLTTLDGRIEGELAFVPRSHSVAVLGDDRVRVWREVGKPHDYQDFGGPGYGLL